MSIETKPVDKTYWAIQVTTYTLVIAAFLFAFGAFAQSAQPEAPHTMSKWWGFVAVIVKESFEYWIGRTSKTNSGSLIELLFNAVRGRQL